MWESGDAQPAELRRGAQSAYAGRPSRPRLAVRRRRTPAEQAALDEAFNVPVSLNVGHSPTKRQSALLNHILLFSSQRAGRQAHSNRLSILALPAQNVPARSGLRAAPPGPAAAARPAAGCRGGTPAARARWSFRARATQDARIEASAPRDLAATDALAEVELLHRAERRLTSRDGIERTETGLQTTRHPQTPPRRGRHSRLRVMLLRADLQGGGARPQRSLGRRRRRAERRGAWGSPEGAGGAAFVDNLFTEEVTTAGQNRGSSSAGVGKSRGDADERRFSRARTCMGSTFAVQQIYLRAAGEGAGGGQADRRRPRRHSERQQAILGWIEPRGDGRLGPNQQAQPLTLPIRCPASHR